jgi:hypothetical protein
MHQRRIRREEGGGGGRGAARSGESRIVPQPDMFSAPVQHFAELN